MRTTKTDDDKTDRDGAAQQAADRLPTPQRRSEQTLRGLIPGTPPDTFIPSTFNPRAEAGPASH